MTTNPIPIDISNMPDLIRLTEEVELTKKPRILKRHKKTVTILIPTSTRGQRTHVRSAPLFVITNQTSLFVGENIK